jgi:hypothetical protein
MIIVKAHMRRPILIATLVAGSLDILYAIGLTHVYGNSAAGMLRFIASGLFPEARDWGMAGALLGLTVHFALMTVMAAAFVVAASKTPSLIRSPLAFGLAYGLALYLVMNLIVLPVRFSMALPSDPAKIATLLVPHLLFVGIPIALITAKFLRR